MKPLFFNLSLPISLDHGVLIIGLQSFSYTKKCGKGNQEEEKKRCNGMKLARMLATKGDLSTGDIWYPSAMKELEMKAHFLF